MATNNAAHLQTNPRVGISSCGHSSPKTHKWVTQANNNRLTKCSNLHTTVKVVDSNSNNLVAKEWVAKAKEATVISPNLPVFPTEEAATLLVEMPADLATSLSALSKRSFRVGLST